jgi:hypothetical protein
LKHLLFSEKFIHGVRNLLADFINLSSTYFIFKKYLKCIKFTKIVKLISSFILLYSQHGNQKKALYNAAVPWAILRARRGARWEAMVKRINDNLKQKQWKWIKGAGETIIIGGKERNVWLWTGRGEGTEYELKRREISSLLTTSNRYKFNQELWFISFLRSLLENWDSSNLDYVAITETSCIGKASKWGYLQSKRAVFVGENLQSQ